ncbi:MAG: LptF/LptG family permease [Phycisphaerales bacterium]|nr:MAG: LptF/LptG family permease [Phycisphaerales bacterium]
MLSVLDRYILRSLMINYLITLTVMICLYVVLDMFVNMDEFTEQGHPLSTVIGNIVDYYTPNVFLFFAQLSGVITLFSCMATIARLRKQNELTAILSSGVSLYRVAAPIVVFGLATTTLLILDTECLIPAVAHKLARDHDDVDGKKAYEVLFLRDKHGALVSAARFHPTDLDLRRLLILTRDESGSVIETLEADRATWDPPGGGRPSGRWLLERGKRTTRVFSDDATLGPREDKHITYPRFYESDLDPRTIQLRQAEGWIRFVSLGQLNELMGDESADLATIVQTKHTRIANPIVGIVLLLLGLPLFLDRSPANVLSDAGKCMLACGLCYVVTFVGQNIRPESASALPTWTPIFIFAPIAIALIDRIRT